MSAVLPGTQIKNIWYDETSYGWHPHRVVGDVPVDRMHSPVICGHCRQIYDSGLVTVTARYADCSMWVSPCCNRQVDDRTWKGLPDIRRIGH